MGPQDPSTVLRRARTPGPGEATLGRSGRFRRSPLRLTGMPLATTGELSFTGSCHTTIPEEELEPRHTSPPSPLSSWRFWAAGEEM